MMYKTNAVPWTRHFRTMPSKTVWDDNDAVMPRDDWNVFLRTLTQNEKDAIRKRRRQLMSRVYSQRVRTNMTAEYRDLKVQVQEYQEQADKFKAQIKDLQTQLARSEKRHVVSDVIIEQQRRTIESLRDALTPPPDDMPCIGTDTSYIHWRHNAVVTPFSDFEIQGE